MYFQQNIHHLQKTGTQNPTKGMLENILVGKLSGGLISNIQPHNLIT